VDTFQSLLHQGSNSNETYLYSIPTTTFDH
jgi:hypothetical protein